MIKSQDTLRETGAWRFGDVLVVLLQTYLTNIYVLQYLLLFWLEMHLFETSIFQILLSLKLEDYELTNSPDTKPNCY